MLKPIMEERSPSIITEEVIINEKHEGQKVRYEIVGGFAKSFDKRVCRHVCIKEYADTFP